MNDPRRASRAEWALAMLIAVLFCAALLALDYDSHRLACRAGVYWRDQFHCVRP